MGSSQKIVDRLGLKLFSNCPAQLATEIPDLPISDRTLRE
jgi:hypothetical protein